MTQYGAPALRMTLLTDTNCSSLDGELEMANAPEFFYRVNQDHTVDSICVICFLTAVASVRIEEAQIFEAIHQCRRSSETAASNPFWAMALAFSN
jgi:hypothetical protein